MNGQTVLQQQHNFPDYKRSKSNVTWGNWCLALFLGHILEFFTFCLEKAGKWGLGFPVLDIFTYPNDQYWTFSNKYSTFSVQYFGKRVIQQTKILPGFDKEKSILLMWKKHWIALKSFKIRLQLPCNLAHGLPALEKKPASLENRPLFRAVFFHFSYQEISILFLLVYLLELASDNFLMYYYRRFQF